MLRCKVLALLLAGGFYTALQAQELFVYSEPASNMPAHSLGIRVSNWLMEGDAVRSINYHLVPELMWGVNKRLMLHAEGFFSNDAPTFTAEGVGVYAKYRFYSHDRVYHHLRLAAFGRIASNNAPLHQQEIDVNGHNAGYQLGLISTQLLHKTALSVTAGYQHTFDDPTAGESRQGFVNKAVNYSLSAGHLILPHAYKDYRQTNLNCMVELIGEVLPDNGRQFIDLAPSLQLIFNSQTRLDIGYKLQLYSTMQRTSPDGMLLRVEHLLYNFL